MIALLAAVVLVAAPAWAEPARELGTTADQAPALLRDVGLAPHLGAAVPGSLVFRDETGAETSLASVFDGRRPVVLSLVYFGCPMLCSQVTTALARSLRAVPLEPGRDFRLVTVSFDPHDGPDAARAKQADALAAYGRRDAGAAWPFLTGDAGAIRALTDAVGFRYAWDATGGQFAHVAVVTVLTPDGRIARYFPGIDYPPRDLRLALVEASAGRIGTTVDRLLLYCYRYDAATGRYTPAIARVVRAAGALTVVGLAALLVALRRGEREGAP